MTKIVLPAQNIKLDLPDQVEPLWYEKLSALAALSYSDGAAYSPVLTAPGGTVPTFTNPPLSGNFAKIGKLVFVGITANNTAGGVAGAGTQQLLISLPIPVASKSLGAREPCGSFANAGQEGLCFVQLTAGATSAPLYQQTVAGTKVNLVPLTCADFNNVARAISWQFFYPVD